MSEAVRHSLIIPIVFIALFIGVAAALLVLRGVFLGYPPPILPKGSSLSAKEQAVVAAVADALFPAGGPIPVSGIEAGLVLYMDTHVRRVPRGIRVLIRLLIAFIEHGPWLFGPKHIRFTRQNPAGRVEALEAMVRSPLYIRRVAFFSIRTILSMGYLANPAVTESIGCASRLAPFEPELDMRARPTRPEVLVL